MKFDGRFPVDSDRALGNISKKKDHSCRVANLLQNPNFRNSFHTICIFTKICTNVPCHTQNSIVELNSSLTYIKVFTNTFYYFSNNFEH
jgi:hypothetical protein